MNQQEIREMKLTDALCELMKDSSSLFIISKTSYNKMPKDAQDMLSGENHPKIIWTDLCKYDNILEVPATAVVKTVIGLGGGTAIDFAKYIAKHRGAKCVAIPSMLSTNVFATNKVAVFTETEKHTEEGVLPDKVILDFEYLNESRLECLYGLVDVFSIFNALRDWQIAMKYSDSTIWDEEIFERAQKLLAESVSIGHKMFIYGDPVDMNLFNIIKDAGYITNDYGSGRPESGSEHIFASALEIKYKHDTGNPIPHAIAVSIGILIMTYFYDMYNKDDLSYPDNTPFRDVALLIRNLVMDEINGYKLRYTYLFDILCTIQPRKDKYTLVDRLYIIIEDEFKPLLHWLEDKGMVFADNDKE